MRASAALAFSMRIAGQDGGTGMARARKEPSKTMETSQPDTQLPAPQPEFTTRPRRLLMVGRIRPGQESAVLEAQLHYPVEAAARAAIERVEGFVGSGHYALLLEIDGDDAQQALTTYLNDPEIRAFHAALQPMVEGFPGPDAAYGPAPLRMPAGTEALEQSSAGPVYSSGQMSLAASMFRWKQREEAS